MVAEKIVHHIVQALLGQGPKSCPEQENVEEICRFFNTIGKQLDESATSRCFNDAYFNRMRELTKHPTSAPQLRFMVRDVLTIEFPGEKRLKRSPLQKKDLGLRPGATAGMRTGRGAPGGMAAEGFPLNRPDTGGMMSGMPGARKISGIPVTDDDNWEVPRSRNMPRGSNSEMRSVGRVQTPLHSVGRVHTPFVGKATPLNF